MQRLLNTHPRISIWGEHAGYLRHISKLVEETIGDEQFVTRLDRETRHRENVVGELKDADMFMPWAAPLPADRFEEVIASFVRDIFAADLPPATRWGFKEIRYGRDVYDMMARLFPKTTTLVVVRDLGGYLRSRARAWRPNLTSEFESGTSLMHAELERYARVWRSRNEQLLNFVDDSPTRSITVPYSRLSSNPDFVNAIFDLLDSSRPDPELVSSVLASKAGSSDTIAASDWDDESTASLFQMVEELVDRDHEAGQLYLRALDQSSRVLGL